MTAIAAVTCTAFGSVSIARGQALAAAPSATQNATQSAVSDPASDVDGSGIPAAANGAELLEFLRDLVQQQPQGASEEEQLEATRKIARTVVVAAERGLGLELDDAQAVETTYFRLQGLDILRQLGDASAAERLQKAIAEARAHEHSEVAAVGMKFYIEASLAQWSTRSDEDKQQLLETLLSHLDTADLEPNDAQTVMVVADFMGEAEDYALARTLLAKALPKFKDHESAQIQGVTPMLEGIARRLELPGKKLELSGALLDGTQLDWKQFQGKVVLIDFWASWCGPCQAEMPNVLEMHQAYRGKGFEVLGICLDDDIEQAKAFLAKEQVPWQTLYSDDPEHRGWEDPRAVEFGVTGIPMAILLDRENRVVSMNARGPELGRLLKELLGDPVAQAAPAQAPSVQQVSNEE